ncbi:MAG: type IV secretory system conjugative DNA transfer family protein [Bacteroidota bacterium]
MRHLFLFLEGIIETVWIFCEELLGKLFNWLFPSGIPRRKQGVNADFGSTKKLLSANHRGFCLSGTKSLSLKDSFQNVVIIGGTGVGKSSIVLLPSLFRMKGSFVVHDPSGELFAKSAGYLKRKGYTIKTLNFANAKISDGFNPLARLWSTSEVNKVASLMIRTTLGGTKGDPFWNLQATSLLALLISLVKADLEVKHTFFEVRNLLNRLTQDADGVMKRATQPELLTELKSFLAYDDKVKLGIIATVASTLQIFTDEDVREVTSYDSLNINSFRSQPTALFVQNPITEQAYYAVLSSIFFEQLFGVLLNRLPSSKELPVFCLIDEGGVLYLPSLAHTIANIRKYQAGILLAIQGKSQLVQNYGPFGAETILNNCFAQLYFTGQSGIQATELEQTLGRYQYEDKKGKTHIRPLMTRDEIRTLSKKQALLLAGNFPPMLLNLIPYYKQKPLSIFSQLPYV